VEIQQVVLLSVFGAVLILSAIRLVHPAAVALAAALGLVAWQGGGVLAGLRADVLLTAAGVMVLAGFVKRSGLVSWLALKAARNARGRPRGILVRMGLLAFVSGALFGPAAAAFVLPVALLLAVELDVPALPFIVTLSWSSLLGGLTLATAQPGNLWVAAGLGVDGWHWLTTMLPFSAAGLAVSLVLAVVVFRRPLRVTNERRARVLEYDESKALENKPLAAKTVAVLLLVAAALVLQPTLHVSPAVIVLAGALLLALLTGRSSLPSALAELDGSTLLWYGSLLIVVGVLASGAWNVSTLPPLAILWGSAVAGAVFDPGTVAGSLSALGISGAAWPLAVAGAAVGGGATLWTGRSAAVSAAVGGSKGPGWTRVVLWSLLFAVVNLAVFSGLWLVFRH
jgi:Na+/H+ antiporter NhaD/arsenite permease-like protein